MLSHPFEPDAACHSFVFYISRQSVCGICRALLVHAIISTQSQTLMSGQLNEDVGEYCPFCFWEDKNSDVRYPGEQDTSDFDFGITWDELEDAVAAGTAAMDCWRGDGLGDSTPNTEHCDRCSMFFRRPEGQSELQVDTQRFARLSLSEESESTTTDERDDDSFVDTSMMLMIYSMRDQLREMEDLQRAMWQMGAAREGFVPKPLPKPPVLPPEILCTIFEWEMISDYDPHSNRSYSTEFEGLSVWSPWAIPQVCREWQLVALEHHNLWSRIKLELGPRTNLKTGPFPESLEKYQTLLARSGDVDLHLRIPSTVYDSDFAGPDPPLAFLRNITHRLRSLHIDMCAPRTLQYFDGCAFPRLKSINTTIWPPWELDEGEIRLTSISSLRTAYNLESYVQRHGGDVEVDIPWAQLINCELWYPDLTVIYKLSNIRRLCIESEMGGIVRLGPHLLPHLEFLSISQRDSTSQSSLAKTILENIRAPVLHTLCLGSTSCYYAAFPTVFEDSSTIRTANIAYTDTIPVPLAETLSFLKRLHRVETLYLGLPKEQYTELWRRLREPSSETLLPHLKTLRIPSDLLDLCGDEIIETLAWRQRKTPLVVLEVLQFLMKDEPWEMMKARIAESSLFTMTGAPGLRWTRVGTAF